MPLYRNTPPLPKDPIWRWILGVLAFSTFGAVLLSILAGERWGNPTLSAVAGWSAVITGLLYLFFRWLGAREARRRAAEGPNAPKTFSDASTGAGLYMGSSHSGGERGGEAGEGGGGGGSDGGGGGGGGGK